MLTVGDYLFPEGRTVFRIRTREVLSRVRREIDIYTLLLHFGSQQELMENLESLEGELERFDRREAQISLQAGRYLTGWRRDYQRVVEPINHVASIHIQILTDDRFERSIEEHQITDTLSESPQTVEVTQAGNGLAYPKIILTATGNLIDPVLSDGERSLSWPGQLNAGETLEFNSDSRTVIKNGGESVLGQVSGEFPLLSPGETEIVYSDDSGSTHSGLLEIYYRDLWI